MKKKKKILIFILCILVIILIILASLFLFFHEEKTDPYVEFESRIEDVNTYIVEDATTIGWIQVQGTNIDYPIIRETAEATISNIDYVWIPDKYTEGNRVPIYGHNILNVSSMPLINGEGHTRFEPLMAFVYYDFAQENLYIQYTHDGVDELYKIYAVTFLYSDEETGESYTDEDDIEEYINEAKEISIYDYDVDVNSSDELISLITCTRYFGLLGKTQFRVDARKVRKNENIDKYSVETNENYDIIK